MSSIFCLKSHGLFLTQSAVASSAADPRLGTDVIEGGRTALDNKTSLLNTPSPRSFLGPRTREYNPYNYTDSIGTYDKAALKEAVFDDDVEQPRDGNAFTYLVIAVEIGYCTVCGILNSVIQ